MKNLTYSRAEYKNYTLSNTSVDESVLSKKHYVLAEFTTGKDQAYAINTNNNFAYPIVGNRFDSELKEKYPYISNERCYTCRPLTLNELK